ncbi:MAG TPA: HAD family hydrolase [Bryobacteraceae bacterium]|nr:HAD family hydrolase [Bryobacteraceae bacterium]
MKRRYFGFSLTAVLALCAMLPTCIRVHARSDDLPSWAEGPAKQAILDFVRVTTEKSSPQFVPPEDRIATFDQDGTTWVSHPIYSEVLFAFDRVVALAPQHPEWKTTEPFSCVIAGDKPAMAKFTLKDIETIVMATHTGMTVEAFQAIVKNWMATAKHPRFNRPYAEMVYQPMLEVMRYLRDHGYRTYIVTGGGQDFVRAYAQQVYGIRPEQIIGSALEAQYEYNKAGQGILMKEPKVLLDNDFAGKPEDIYLFLGKRPYASFGNSTGDRQMLEYTHGGGGARLAMLVLHDDAVREYAYGPAQGLPDSKVGTFTQELYDEAKSKGWTVISMKNDWKRIFAFDQ